jgi:DNA polymerase sigma
MLSQSDPREKYSQEGSPERQNEKERVNKRKRRRCRKEEEAYSEAARTLWGRHLSRQLEGLVDDLGVATNAQYDSKVIAFERVRYFCQLLFPTSSTVLFGSASTGLALPNSDVDILLVGLPCQ